MQLKGPIAFALTWQAKGVPAGRRGALVAEPGDALLARGHLDELRKLQVRARQLAAGHFQVVVVAPKRLTS